VGPQSAALGGVACWGGVAVKQVWPSERR
jgi:hypothetical protein